MILLRRFSQNISFSQNIRLMRFVILSRGKNCARSIMTFIMPNYDYRPSRAEIPHRDDMQSISGVEQK